MKINWQAKNEKIQISLSKEHNKFKNDIKKCFGSLDVNFQSDLIRASEDSLPMQILIFLGSSILSGITWDLLKSGIQNVLKKFNNVKVAIRDSESIIYSIFPNNSIFVLAVPERIQEFKKIKTLNNLIEYLKNKHLKLGQVLKLEYGKPLSKEYRNIDGLYPVYGANGIKDYSDKFYFDKLSIIVGRKGSVGEINLTAEKFWPLDVTYFVTYDDTKYDLKFLYNLLKTLELKKFAKGVKPGINRNEVYSINVKIPAFSEQHRIVKILDKVFEEIEKAKQNTEKNLKNTKDLFESYLSKIFTNSEWSEETLDNVCEMINRGVSPKYIESNGLVVLNQRCIRDHKIDFSFSRLHDIKNKKIANNKLIRIGDVLVNSTGVGTLGRVAQVRILPTEATVDTHVTIVRPLKDNFYNDFFGYALIYIEKEIAKSGEGASGQIELSRNTLKNNFKICYPESLSEQKSIVKKLDELSEKTKKLEEIYKQKLADLEELKKSILKKAFSGEI